MKILIKCDLKLSLGIIKKLKTKYRFESVTYDASGIILHTKRKIYSYKGALRHKDIISKIRNVKEVEIHKDKTEIVINRVHHIFFDVDSTLTHQGIETPGTRVRDVFDDLIQAECRLYFCTGRALSDVRNLMRRYDIRHDYSIAEGGGILIEGIKDYTEIGDRYNVDKFMHYMRSHGIRYREDLNQMNRITEFVILKKGISEKVLQNAITNSNINVEYHASNNAYHISKKGINKGTAVRKIKERLRLETRYHKFIGMGDSDLDLPMFAECDDCYIVNGSTLCDKSTNCYQLSTHAPDAIEELRDLLIPFTSGRRTFDYRRS